jgi:hypothetical protein
MVKAGINVNSKKGDDFDNRGYLTSEDVGPYPLCNALIAGHREIATLLMENGAKFSTRFWYGEPKFPSTVQDLVQAAIPDEDPSYKKVCAEIQNKGILA